jgi:uncharacterized membrane protein
VAAFSNVIFVDLFALFYPAAKKSFSLVCHQDPARTFTFAGAKMLVCVRCTGLYSGAAISSLLFLFPLTIREPHKKFLLIAAVPVFIDVILYNAGLYSYNNTVSLITGLILGSVLFIFILAAIEKYIYTNE